MEILKVQLTADNIKNLNSNPIPVLSAPGLGKAYIVHSMMNFFNFGTIVFDNTNTMAVTNSDYNSSYNQLGNINSTQDATGAASSITAPTDVEVIKENTALYLVADGDSTAGDSTVDVYIIYSVVDL